MSRQANVQSVDALRRFRAALCTYAEAVQDVLAQLQLESQRTVDWVENDQMSYWPMQVRESRDALCEARNLLENKQLTFDDGPRSACVEERKAVEQAKERSRYAEQQVALVRQLIPMLNHEADEYQGTLGKLAQLLDTDLPLAIANLDRMIESLNRYTIMREPSAGIGTLDQRSGTTEDSKSAVPGRHDQGSDEADRSKPPPEASL